MLRPHELPRFHVSIPIYILNNFIFIFLPFKQWVALLWPLIWLWLHVAEYLWHIFKSLGWFYMHHCLQGLSNLVSKFACLVCLSRSWHVCLFQGLPLQQWTATRPSSCENIALEKFLLPYVTKFFFSAVSSMQANSYMSHCKSAWWTAFPYTCLQSLRNPVMYSLFSLPNSSYSCLSLGRLHFLHYRQRTLLWCTAITMWRDCLFSPQSSLI